MATIVMADFDFGDCDFERELVEAAGIPARRGLFALTLLQIRQLVEEEGRRFSTPVELQEES